MKYHGKVELLKNGYCYGELAAECHQILSDRRTKKS